MLINLVVALAALDVLEKTCATDRCNKSAVVVLALNLRRLPNLAWGYHPQVGVSVNDANYRAASRPVKPNSEPIHI